MKGRLFWRLYCPYLLVILLCVLGSGAAAFQVIEGVYLRRTAADLEARARLIERQVAEGFSDRRREDLDDLADTLGRAIATRITVIRADGEVLADSEKDPSTMENHRDRPEVQTALAGGVGVKRRHSATLHIDMMYVAVPLREDGRVVAVVRTALPLSEINRALGAICGRVALGGAVVAVLAAGLAVFVSRRISRPLREMMKGAERFARGDFSQHVAVPDIEEIAVLAMALNRMADQLDETIRTLNRQTGEREAVLSSMIEGVVAVDTDGNVLRMNKAAERLAGMSQSEAEGRPLQEAFRTVDLKQFVDAVLKGQETVEGEIVLRGAPERVLRVRGTVLRDAQGGQIGALLVLNDVTRLHRLEMVRRDFVANVSHELQTPITSIRGFVETLRDGGLEDAEKAKHFLDIIARQADRLNATVKDLLILSRIEVEAEAGRLQRLPANLRDILEAAVQDCQAKAAEFKVHIALACPQDLTVRVDPLLIEQAVVNLLDNAIKYSRPKTTVEVEAEALETETVIRVRDRGCGIASEHLPRIFERFYRVDKGRSRELGGTGLGLAIVKHIAQAHGGRVSVESVLGKGSTFTLHLPVV